MKRYILYGLTMLMAFPLGVYAQEEEESEDATQTIARKIRKPQKKYETRTVRGTVLDAATEKPIAGAMVKTQGIEGFSALTDDQGNYTISVPLFASAIYISTPSYNSVVIGLDKNENQRTARLLNSSFKSEYTETTNILNSASTSSFKYTNAINIKEEVQK